MEIHEVALTSTVSGSNWNLKMLLYAEGGKPEYQEKKPSEQGCELTFNKLNPYYMASSPGFKPGPHWWAVSVLITGPALLPIVCYSI